MYDLDKMSDKELFDLIESQGKALNKANEMNKRLLRLNKEHFSDDELLQIKAGAGVRILEDRKMLEMYRTTSKEHKFIEAMEWSIKTNESIIKKCVEMSDLE